VTRGNAVNAATSAESIEEIVTGLQDTAATAKNM
jgi:hypothetical protein